MKLSFTKSWTVILASLALMFSAIGVTPAHAATTRTVSDCSAPSGAADRLVEQINAAIADDTINFSCSGTITLAATITIGKKLTIDGTGQTVTISGGNLVQVLRVNAALTLNNLTIADGKNSSGPGGGIFNNWFTLVVTNSAFSGNSTSGSGGGIYNNHGTLTITNSTFSGNSASTSNGGGIYNDTGTLTITNSTFSGNSADIWGGGVFTTNGTLIITNSTFFGNSAVSSGGGGGGIKNYLDTTGVTLRNTIVANSSSGGNCSGAITNGGNNIDSGTTCGWGSTNGSKSSTPPLLGALTNNGGPTQTFALLTGSPAIDGVTFNAPNSAPSTDQRGVARPQGVRYDIGAFELDNTPPTVAMTSLSSNPTHASPIVVTVTFSESVTGFTSTDIVPTNGSVSSFTAVNSTTYTFDLTPTADGLVTANIAAGVATDLAGNGNTIAAQFSRTYTTVYNLFLPLILR